MKQAEMMLLVPRKLKEIEKEYGIRILYAAESGSRAWGTASPESDFDVRFIYIRPEKEYLRLQQHRDVLEFPIVDGWDICGWDLAKLLKLLHSSNTQIYEWFGSPVVYVDDGFSRRIRPLLDAYFSTKTGGYHYLSQADLKMKQQKKVEQTKVKHYLYCFQHFAAARWILEHKAPAPVSFSELRAWMPEDLHGEVSVLLQKKRDKEPLMPHSPLLDARLLQERDELEQLLRQLPKELPLSWDLLEGFFLSELERL